MDTINSPDGDIIMYLNPRYGFTNPSPDHDSRSRYAAQLRIRRTNLGSRSGENGTSSLSLMDMGNEGFTMPLNSYSNLAVASNPAIFLEILDEVKLSLR